MKILVKKTDRLQGEITAGGSKNAALPIMAATMLCGKKCKLYDIPNLADTRNLNDIMSGLGVKMCDGNYDTSNLTDCMTRYDDAKKLRGSFLLAAPLLSRFGRAQIALPGGCPIGTRPIDLHLKGFRALGAEVETLHGMVDIKCKKLKGAKIYLDFPSVGATENLIMGLLLQTVKLLLKMRRQSLRWRSCAIF